MMRERLIPIDERVGGLPPGGALEPMRRRKTRRYL